MSDKKSICLMNDSFPPLIDGVANVVVNYAKHINNGLGKAIVATPQNPEAQDSDFDFPVLRYPSIDMRKTTGYYAGVPFSGEFMTRLQEEKVDVLHTHCPVASTYLARSLRDQVKAPVVLTYHTKFDIDIEKVVKSRLVQESAIRALVENISACDEIWVVSKGAGENLVSLGYEGDYIVMPNGVDLPKGRMPEDKVAAATAGYDLPKGLPVYLFVGRLMWYKGIRISLDALAELAAEGRDFRMVIIGGGADEQEIKDYVKELGLEDKIFFTGAIRDREIIRCWYTRADLFLFPSTFDTNGLVVREAAACSLPSVLVAGSCAAEDVTEDRNAFLIEENSASMADCLRRCGFSFELMSRIGENAANELYASWEDVVKTAYERYGIVTDLYQSGYYDRRKKAADYFWEFSGDLMEAVSRVELERGELWEDILARRDLAKDTVKGMQEKLQTRFEETQNRIDEVQDLIAERLDETQNRIEAGVGETRAKLESGVGEVKAKLEAGVEETKAKFEAGVEETRARFETGMEETKAKFEAGVEETRARFETGMEETKAKFEAGIDETREKLEDAKQLLKDKATEAYDQFEEYNIRRAEQMTGGMFTGEALDTPQDDKEKTE